MTEKHPITPPPELVLKWARSSNAFYEAARWGADQELEATLGLMATLNIRGVDYVRNARRPKPPSLKEQALDELIAAERLYPADWSTIRRALEALDD